MTRTFPFIMVVLATFVLGLKSEAPAKSRYSLIHAPSRVVVNFTEAPVFNSWAAGPAIGHDAAYGLEASPAATASEMSPDYVYPVCRVHTLLDEGYGGRNRTLPPVPALPAFVNVAAIKAWYTRKAISSQSGAIDPVCRAEVFSGLGKQRLAQQLATTNAGVKGDALVQLRSRRATKGPVGGSPSKLRSSPVAIQSLVALCGAVVTGSAVGGMLILLVGADVDAAGGSTAKKHNNGEDRTRSTFEHLLKSCFLAAVIPVLLFWVFGRWAGHFIFFLAAVEGVGFVSSRVVELVLIPFVRRVFCAEQDNEEDLREAFRHALRLGEYLCSQQVDGETR